MHDAPSFLRRRTAGLAAAALAALAAAAAAALADSLAYIKAGNVFLSTTDGARSYQVTFDGGYSIRPCRLVWRTVTETGVEFL